MTDTTTLTPADCQRPGSLIRMTDGRVANGDRFFIGNDQHTVCLIEGVRHHFDGEARRNVLYTYFRVRPADAGEVAAYAAEAAERAARRASLVN